MKLLVQLELNQVLNLETSQNSVLVGRSSKCKFVIKHPSISRSHCQIDYVDGKFYVTDLKSLNGTFINGNRLIPLKRAPLPDQADLRLGSLGCELMESFPSSDKSQIQKINLTGSFSRTANFNISQKDSSLNLNDKINSKPKKSLNPISENFEYPERVEKKGRLAYLKLFILVLIIVLALIEFGGR
jgi:pSer/pThr/pTyr-binding forkhead associated (FHA) protein